MEAQRVDHQAADVAPTPPRMRAWLDGLGCPRHRGASLTTTHHGPHDLCAHRGRCPVLCHNAKLCCGCRAHQA
eukprot:11052112-Alexandrium_andersonii.AAC.1